MEKIHVGCGRKLSYRYTDAASFFFFYLINRRLMFLSMLEIHVLQMMGEVEKWPYNFPASEDFQKSEQRGTVNGRLLVRDR